MKEDLTPELWEAQSAGRPAWQKGLPMGVLMEIDRLAYLARKDHRLLDAAGSYADYVDYTARFRRPLDSVSHPV